MSDTRTPIELIQMYWERVWNNREFELIREICADPIVRHDPHSVTHLSHDEQIARVRQQSAEREPYFSHEVLHGDDHYVTSVWNMVTRKGEPIELCGIEVFRVENGRFIDAWNSSYAGGLWGREGDLSVPHDLPPPALLASTERIDPPWLQQVFFHAGLDVPKIGMVRTEAIGHGNLGATVRADILYNADAGDAPRSVVCKFSSQIPQASEMSTLLDVYRREAQTYALFGQTPPLRVPRVYLARADNAGREINLVMEDLSRRTVAGDQIAGCSITQAAAVVTQLARLHRHYWKAPEIDSLPWLYRRNSMLDLALTYAAGVGIFHERFDGRLSVETFEIIDGFAPLIDDWLTAEPPARTLLHNDPRVDNVLFDMSQPEAIIAYLIDWQFTGVGDAQSDIAYFLTGSLPKEERRHCERELIALHASEIAQADPDYTLSIALDAYRFNTVAGLQNTVGAALAMPSTAHTDTLLMTLAERNCAAISDWDALSFIRHSLARF